VPINIIQPHITTLVNAMPPRPSEFAINSAPRRVAVETYERTPVSSMTRQIVDREELYTIRNPFLPTRRGHEARRAKGGTHLAVCAFE
jgi:hypothetical protein